MNAMGIFGHGVIIMYNMRGNIVYSSACDEQAYVEILKASGAMEKLNREYLHVIEWEGYSISIDTIELKGERYCITHIIPNISRVEHYRQLAYKDCLTGLYNRNFWEHIKSGSMDMLNYDAYTIILIDIDNLKYINDETGHSGGDYAIRKVAKAIKSSIRDTDIAIRYGGDEFLIIIPGIEEDISAKKVIYRIRARIAKLNMNEGLQMSVSAGYASGNGFRSLKETADLADRAMFKEKRNKKELPSMVSRTEISAIRDYIEDTRKCLNDLITDSLDGDLDSEELLKVSGELDELIESL